MFVISMIETESIYLIGGIALILLVVAQLSFWVGSTVSQLLADRKQQALNLKILEEKLSTAKVQRIVSEGESGWNGLRSFVVEKLVRETADIVSIYLRPQDQRPLPFFQPGQYLTFHFEFPGESKPLVRCYSISSVPNDDFYRISVKKIVGADSTTGRVSSYLNDELAEGDILHAKSPTGKFSLDLTDDRPVIMLAAGIGLTPIYCMLATMVKHQPHRRAIVFFGGANSKEHPLRTELLDLAKRNRNIHLVNCYSRPLPTDAMGSDYDVEGRVEIDLVKSMLPATNFHFYLCGPGAFMSALVKGLMDWGVPKNQVHFEAFGPSSIQVMKPPRLESEGTKSDKRECKLLFKKSDVCVDWKEDYESILAAAEENGVVLDSGCRAGNCGTCEIAVLKGRVEIKSECGAKTDEGETLSCVARPLGDVEINA